MNYTFMYFKNMFIIQLTPKRGTHGLITEKKKIRVFEVQEESECLAQ